MISGIHNMIYSSDEDATRAFFRDVLGLESVDAGNGWLIFALPPAELAVHPDKKGGSHELYLMCDDVTSTVEQMKSKGIEFTQPVTDRGWGLTARFKLPGAGEMGIYQPKHPTAIRKL